MVSQVSEYDQGYGDALEDAGIDPADLEYGMLDDDGFEDEDDGYEE